MVLQTDARNITKQELPLPNGDVSSKSILKFWQDMPASAKLTDWPPLLNQKF